MARFKNDAEFEKAMKKKDPRAWEIDDIYTEIVSRIVVERNKLGWSQEKLASKCGLKQSAIARLEMCSNKPRLDTVIKVLTSLGFRLVLEKEKCEIEKLIDLNAWREQKEKKYKWDYPKTEKVTDYEETAMQC